MEIVSCARLSPQRDHESEDVAITLKDYTRQMKTLRKRLASPDRAIVKQIRGEIMKGPDQSERKEKEVDFDERLKSSLKNNIDNAVKEVIASVLQDG
ncbi:hypothetical protein FOBRF1_009966 [Fusarium oxysporum]